MSLALIPEIISLSYILIVLTVTGEVVEVNYFIRLISWIFSIRILVIGLSKVQSFSYGLAILNIVLPALILVFIQSLWRIL